MLILIKAWLVITVYINMNNVSYTQHSTSIPYKDMLTCMEQKKLTEEVMIDDMPKIYGVRTTMMIRCVEEG